MPITNLVENRLLDIHGWPDSANNLSFDYTDTSAMSDELEVGTSYLVRASTACFISCGTFVEAEGEGEDEPIALATDFPLLAGDLFIFSPHVESLVIAAIRDTDSGTLHIVPLKGRHL